MHLSTSVLSVGDKYVDYSCTRLLCLFWIGHRATNLPSFHQAIKVFIRRTVLSSVRVWISVCACMRDLISYFEKFWISINYRLIGRTIFSMNIKKLKYKEMSSFGSLSQFSKPMPFSKLLITHIMLSNDNQTPCIQLPNNTV